PQVPPTRSPGTYRSYKVCRNMNCSTHPTGAATAKTVGVHVAVHVDNASRDTLTTADHDSVAAVFDTLRYPTDTAAFGRESDIDRNGLVLVLMTPKVNSLVTSAQCNDPAVGFVAGYVYGCAALHGLC